MGASLITLVAGCNFCKIIKNDIELPISGKISGPVKVPILRSRQSPFTVTVLKKKSRSDFRHLLENFGWLFSKSLPFITRWNQGHHNAPKDWGRRIS